MHKAAEVKAVALEEELRAVQARCEALAARETQAVNRALILEAELRGLRGQAAVEKSATESTLRECAPPPLHSPASPAYC